MKKYKATFLVHAQVFVTVDVSEPTRELALAAAFDQVPNLKGALGHINSIDAASADLLEFAAEEGTAVAPPSPMAGRNDFSVQLFNGLNDASPSRELCQFPYATAKEYVESIVHNGEGSVGRARVVDAHGKVAYEKPASRGGWEVIGIRDGTTNYLHSWLDNEATAKDKAVAAFFGKGKGAPAYSEVHILDFTDRTAGPRVKRILR